MEKLAQDQEVMFERNIAIIASRKHEVQVYSDGFVYEGFLCGLDSKWVQLYGHEEGETNKDKQWRFILLGKENVSSLGPTGRSVHDLDDQVREFVSKKIKTFSDVCDKFLIVRGFANDRGKDK